MIKVICDRCENDCESNAYEIRVAPIHNPTPLYAFDRGDLKITDTIENFRFIVCQTCYKAMGFPNYFSVIRTKKLVFRKLDDNNETD